MAENKILEFGQSGIEGVDIEDEATYTADPQRLVGNQTGVARRELVNTAQRQASAVAAGVANYLAINGVDVPFKATADTISAGLSSVVTGKIGAITAAGVATKWKGGETTQQVVNNAVAGYDLIISTQEEFDAWAVISDPSIDLAQTVWIRRGIYNLNNSLIKPNLRLLRGEGETDALDPYNQGSLMQTKSMVKMVTIYYEGPTNTPVFGYNENTLGLTVVDNVGISIILNNTFLAYDNALIQFINCQIACNGVCSKVYTTPDTAMLTYVNTHISFGSRGNNTPATSFLSASTIDSCIITTQLSDYTIIPIADFISVCTILNSHIVIYQENKAPYANLIKGTHPLYSDAPTSAINVLITHQLYATSYTTVFSQFDFVDNVKIADKGKGSVLHSLFEGCKQISNIHVSQLSVGSIFASACSSVTNMFFTTSGPVTSIGDIAEIRDCTFLISTLHSTSLTPYYLLKNTVFIDNLRIEINSTVNTYAGLADCRGNPVVTWRNISISYTHEAGKRTANPLYIDFTNARKISVDNFKIISTRTYTSVIFETIFKDCNNLSNVELINIEATSVVGADTRAFFHTCKMITNVTIFLEDNLTVSGQTYCFYSCEQVSGVNITLGISTMPGRKGYPFAFFSRCSLLDHITILGSNKEDYYFTLCDTMSNIKLVSIAPGVNHGLSHINQCTNLSNMTLSMTNTNNDSSHWGALSACWMLSNIKVDCSGTQHCYSINNNTTGVNIIASSASVVMTPNAEFINSGLRP